jgi:hypothetical protein
LGAKLTAPFFAAKQLKQLKDHFYKLERGVQADDSSETSE